MRRHIRQKAEPRGEVLGVRPAGRGTLDGSIQMNLFLPICRGHLRVVRHGGRYVIRRTWVRPGSTITDTDGKYGAEQVRDIH